MLRKIRIVLALLFFIATTLLFLDFTGTIHAWLGWMAKVQFFPAVLALNAGVVITLVLLTLVFGRVYCSVICPMGVFQDIISWINGKTKKKKRFRFKYKKANNWLRYGILVIFIATIIAGFTAIASILEPYSAWGRIAGNLLAPVYGWSTELLAMAGDRLEAYTIYSTDVWIKSLPTFIVAAITLVIIAVLAWKGGRTYCTQICPVGSILSLISRFSLFGPVIDSDKCRACGLCGKQCKSHCIDMENHVIDYSRCVDCMDCIKQCNEGAISYKFRKHRAKTLETCAGRRVFMTSAAIVTTAAVAKAAEIPGGKARQTRRITPPGSVSLKHFDQHCTACQLCISTCPNKVLRPSDDLEHFMQPHMVFDKGHCRPECTLCSSVCPNNAIFEITPEEKTAIAIGYAVVDLGLCVAEKDGVHCGNCARHCPAGAIQMVKKEGSEIRIPAVNTEKCIGCGACEHLCPTDAIYVEGYEVHQNR